MKIAIVQLPESWQRSIDHLLRLFFEQPHPEWISGAHGDDQRTEPDQSGLLIDWILEEKDGRNDVKCRLAEVHGKLAMEAVSPVTGDVHEEQAALKRAYQRSLLHVLEQYTKIEQPWGILTGVRPTKLVHQSRDRQKQPLAAELSSEYRIGSEKIDLLMEIADRQLKVIPDLYSLRDQVSLYIGIPYCPTKCAYCTFPAYAIGGRQGDVDSFLYGLYWEMEQIGRWLKDNRRTITTIYFGGGTPTSITASEMDRLYTHMHAVFPDTDKVREITVEAGRPDTITAEKLTVLKKHGIDRISINPQSYTQATLDAIGRHHTVEETIEKFWLAREMGMHNVNMDLIIGLPGEGLREFEHTLRQTAALMPESLTVHTLSFKRASEMTRNKDKYLVADGGEIERMMSSAQEWTKMHGYAPYYLYRQKNILGNLENVGYALPGKESLYNILIMEEMQTIIGLGCGAASKWVDPASGAISRFANPKEPRAYNENFKAYTGQKIERLNDLFANKANLFH